MTTAKSSQLMLLLVKVSSEMKLVLQRRFLGSWDWRRIRHGRSSANVVRGDDGGDAGCLHEFGELPPSLRARWGRRVVNAVEGRANPRRGIVVLVAHLCW